MAKISKDNRATVTAARLRNKGVVIAACIGLIGILVSIYFTKGGGQKVENSPNSIIQFNENGDNIVNQSLPEPKLKFDNIEQTKMEDSSYLTKAMLLVETKYDLSGLKVTARGKSILDFSVMPYNGMYTFRDFPITRNSASRLLTNVSSGAYMVRVKTEENEKINFELDLID